MMTRLWNIPTFYALLGAAVLLLAAPAAADTLDMPAPPALQEPDHSVTLPGRGMSMLQVEDRFGTPREKFDEVGDPPITRWVYPDFTVYFEYQYVINAVAHDAMAAPGSP
ncbi:hypothetical protein [Thiohalophilus sp.]|uniref:hypothetical protein n=1 Tax=Thiohalophilus sp. TaxID=3028392 RepID=UPI002ACE7BF2|nr:hypothetical protein [Thiohalophilus sp.]MDZ7805040.1 hypothetical protein [Thiohalophilus sp.]